MSKEQKKDEKNTNLVRFQMRYVLNPVQFVFVSTEKKAQISFFVRKFIDKNWETHLM